MALNLVVMGPPGAGKGTQAERFAREHGIPKISTGDILREAVSAQTDLGTKVKIVIDRGDLVGDDLMIGIVRDRLSRPDAIRGFVLDGFPRTVPQANALDQILATRGPVIVVEIQVPDEELVRRVRTRRVCANCGRTVSAFGPPSAAGAGGFSGAAPAGTSISDAALAEKCMNCGGTLVSRSDDGESVVRDRLKVYWRETQPMIAFYHKRPTYRAVNGALAPERVRDALIAAVASALGKPAAELKSASGQRPESNA